MSKPFTYDKERICYIHTHYMGTDIDINSLSDRKSMIITTNVVSYRNCDEDYILELIDGLPHNHVNLTIFGLTLLAYAIKYSHIRVIKYLLETYDNINLDDIYLHYAIMKNNEEIIEMLLEHKKINVNLQHITNDTALHFAVVNHNVNAVKLLLNHPQIDTTLKTNSSYNGKTNLTALEVAKIKEYDEIVELLEEYDNNKN